MATQYPNGIDNTSSLPYVTNGVSPMVGDDVNRLRDAVVAVETELGANPSGTFTSVDARIEAAETAISDYANSTFLVLSTDGFISQERVFSPSVNFAVVDGGAGANYEIDLASSVGVGTATPAPGYSLTLDGDGAARIGGVTLRNSGTDTFYIGTATASDAANVSLMNPNAGYVAMGTDGTERIRITSTGDVGLGTSLPAGLLHVSGGDLLVEAGDVGIGTLTPSELLHISGGNLLLESAVGTGVPYATIKGTQGGIQLSSSNSIGKLDILDSTGTVAISLLNNGDNRLVGANSADFSFHTNNTEKMRLTATGELLVSTTANPDSAQLHISGGSITHSSDQFNARPGSGADYEWINRNGAGHTWYVNSAATQAMTIAGTGNVGIGTASPAALLSIGASSQFRVDSSGDISRIRDISYSFPATQGIASSVLHNNGSGSLDWSLVSDTEIIGGLQAVADIAARDAIPAAQRKEGMIAYSQADDRHFVLEGGVTNGDWKDFGSDSRLLGGFRVVANDAERDAIPQNQQKVGMVVYVVSTGVNWQLTAIAGPPGVFSQWLPQTSNANQIGGLLVVPDIAGRQNIPLIQQVAGMLIWQSDTRELWRLLATSAIPIPTSNFRGLLKGGSSSSTEFRIEVSELQPADTGGSGIRGKDIRTLRGMGRSLYASRALVLNGSELNPSLVPLFPDYAPGARIEQGEVITAGGTVVDAGDAGEIDLSAGGVGGNYIADAAAPSLPANIYVFIRSDGVARASSTPPDFAGRPATADSGYTTSDYGYLGMLRPLAYSGGDYSIVWGTFSVVHMGNGVREVCFDAADAASNFFGQGSATIANGGSAIVDVGPVTSPNTLLPTSSGIKVFNRLTLNGDGALTSTTIGAGSAFEGGILSVLGVDIPSIGGYWTASGSFIMPRLGVRPKAQLSFTRIGGSGSRTVVHATAYIGMIENVNNPIVVIQSASFSG